MIYGSNPVKMSHGVLKPNILAIMQSGNLFAYALNNPIRYSDPSGLNVWLIHGTFSSPSQGWENDIGNYLTGDNGPFAGQGLDLLDWSDTGINGAGNSRGARKKAAKRLFDDVLAHHTANPDDPINLVAHSHGGNVAILATNMLAAEGIKVENLVTIGTPVREYKLDKDVTVGQHVNVYNVYDNVQTGGGGILRVFGSRDFKGAENINAKDAKGHSSMHKNQDIWKKYITPKIK
jgi:pimeloyl-ACP methyl ester carboxylesterase